MKQIAIAAAFALSQLVAAAAFAQTAANPGAASGAMQKENSPAPMPKSTKSREAVKAESGMATGDAASAPMRKSKSRSAMKSASAASDARLHGGDNPPAR